MRSLLLFVLISTVSIANGMLCNIGPIEKEYSLIRWSIFSCPDGETVIFHAHSVETQNQILFEYFKDAGQYHMRAHCNDEEFMCASARRELRGLNDSDIEELIEQTHRIAEDGKQ
jgi:hypothetical protein